MKNLIEVVENSTLPVDVADKYLKLYIADIDWKPHISSLWNNAVKKFRNETVAKDHVKKAVACATILPLVQKISIPEIPSNLLFWCTGWKQFNEGDWFDIFKGVIKEDLEIIEKRNKCISIGVTSRVDTVPITRQGYNWLYEKSVEEIGHNVDVQDKMKNIVKAYGGAVVCNLFVNHKNHVDHVFNWRSGYFFEKEIHKVYTIEDILKIKAKEISKINSKYIMKVGEKNV
jgi:hypothetical protein